MIVPLTLQQLRPAWRQVHVAANILGEKTGTYDQTGLCASYFCWINRYRSQVHATLYILGWKIRICDRTGLRYTPRLRFWVRKQVTATGQASGTRCGSYFGWKNWYLRPLHILSEKTVNCDWLGLWYTPRFIFWEEKQVFATGQASALHNFVG